MGGRRELREFPVNNREFFRGSICCRGDTLSFCSLHRTFFGTLINSIYFLLLLTLKLYHNEWRASKVEDVSCIVFEIVFILTENLVSP